MIFTCPVCGRTGCFVGDGPGAERPCQVEIVMDGQVLRRIRTILSVRCRRCGEHFVAGPAEQALARDHEADMVGLLTELARAL